jgi:hypothetical protein
MQKDAIVGAITKYNVPNVLLYVTSLLNSGFSGDKYMVVYDVGYEIVEFLKRAGFTVFTFDNLPDQRRYAYTSAPKNFHVNVDRFYHMWYFLSKLPAEVTSSYRYLISTDVGDVVFQSNPSDWLQEQLPTDSPYKLVAACESIRYGDEVLWGAMNMQKSFGPAVFDHMKERLIYNAGTMAGRFETLRDLFLNLYLMCGAYGTENPDQAAYNVLLSLSPYKDVTRFMMSRDGWACQMGTTADPKKLAHFKDSVIEPPPLIETDPTKRALVMTQDGANYVIVHQYNRLDWLVPRLLLTYVPGIRLNSGAA